jgi:hypothetical protein
LVSGSVALTTLPVGLLALERTNALGGRQSFCHFTKSVINHDATKDGTGVKIRSLDSGLP